MQTLTEYEQGKQETIIRLEQKIEESTLFYNNLIKEINIARDELVNVQKDLSSSKEKYDIQGKETIANYNNLIRSERERMEESKMRLVEMEKDLYQKEKELLAQEDVLDVLNNEYYSKSKELDEREKDITFSEKLSFKTLEDIECKKNEIDKIYQEAKEFEFSIEKRKNEIGTKEERLMEKEKELAEQGHDFNNYITTNKSNLLQENNNIMNRFRELKILEEKTQAEMRTLLHSKNFLTKNG
jgi:chromosome segregation ATPase